MPADRRKTVSQADLRWLTVAQMQTLETPNGENMRLRDVVDIYQAIAHDLRRAILASPAATFSLEKPIDTWHLDG